MADTDLLSHISRAIRDIPAMSNLFNWNEIAKIPLPDAFIAEHSDKLNWDVLCKYQPLSMAIVDKYDYLIKTKLHILVTNSNLSSDVFKFYADKMDWESAQKHQKFTPELLEHFRGSLDLVIVLQHQVLPDQFINELLEKTVAAKQWGPLRKYLTLAFTHQKVSNAFVNRFLLLETNVNEEASLTATANSNQQPIILVDLPTIIKNQTLSEEFLSTFCIPYIQARNEICRSQKLSNGFINTYFDQLDLRKLLKYQRMDEQTLTRCCERGIFTKATRPTVASVISGLMLSQDVTVVTSDAVLNAPVQEAEPQPVVEEPIKDAERRLRYANTLMQNQVYSIDLATRIINSFPNTQWRKLLWCNVFVRSLEPVGNDLYLGFSPETVSSQVLPNVNWDIIANDSTLTPVQLDGIIEVAGDKMPWYLYVKKNQLGEPQIEHLHDAGLLDAITWWRIITAKRNTVFSHEFLSKFENRKYWWNFVPATGEFYAACLQALDNVDNINVEGSNLPQIRSRADIRSFLTDFTASAEWKKILHDEILPEWFIQLFGHAQLSSKINLFWWNICRWQPLTQKFIDRNITKLDLQVLLTYQKVDEAFLRNHMAFFTPENWKMISAHQNLSDEFRAEFSKQLSV